MPSLQIIVKALDQAETVLSDRTIEYTHPAEIAGLYNQLITIENPNGSYILFNEVPENYTDPHVSLMAMALREGVSYRVTLIGDIVGQIDRQMLCGTVSAFNKQNHIVTYDITGGNDLALTGYQSYIQKPELIITDPDGVCRLGVIVNQKIYVPQPSSVRYDLPIDWPLPGQEAYISFENGVTKVKLTGNRDVILVPVCNTCGLSLEEYLLTHSNFDRPIVAVNGDAASVSIVETINQMGGRVFPKDEAEVLKVLNLIDTDPKYEALRGQFINPYTYGTVSTVSTLSGTREVTVNATVPLALADNTKKFLVGSLIEKRRTDQCIAATTDDYTILGGGQRYKGQNIPEVTQYENFSLYRWHFVPQLASAIDIGEYYLLVADMLVKGDSGRFLGNTLNYSMPVPGSAQQNISQLPLKVDIQYNTDFPVRDLGLRVWPATPEEYTAVKNAFTAKSVDTGAWVNVFDTVGLTSAVVDGIKEYTWDTPPTFQGFERLASGIAINKTVYDQVVQGNYNDNFVIGAIIQRSAEQATGYTWQSLKDQQFKAVQIGDEYFFGPDTMIVPYNAQNSGLDMSVFVINFGDGTGTRYVTSMAGAKLKFTTTG